MYAKDRIRARMPATTRGTAGPRPAGFLTDPDRVAGRSQWRGTGFGSFWGANAVSLLGDRITILAIPFAAVALHASPLQVSVLTTASFLPWLLAGVFAGVMVDRWALYRKIMIWADLGRGALLFSVPLAAARGMLTYWQLLAVALLTGLLTVFFQAASSALLPKLVGIDRLPAANAKLSTSSSVMMTAGPALLASSSKPSAPRSPSSPTRCRSWRPRRFFARCATGGRRQLTSPDRSALRCGRACGTCCGSRQCGRSWARPRRVTSVPA